MVVINNRVTQIQYRSPTDLTVLNSQYLAGRFAGPDAPDAAERRLRRGDRCAAAAHDAADDPVPVLIGS